MKSRNATIAMAFAASLLTSSALVGPAFAGGVVTIYSADGLHDGNGSWYETEFAAFTKATGITVQYIEAGSGGVVERVAKEKSNPQADVLVTLPPFVQRAAADGLLQDYKPAGADQIDGGADKYRPLVNNYMNFIYNSAVLSEAPKSYNDLLDPKFKGKIQYSTPGQAGDGTAVMLQIIHAFGGEDAGFEFMKKLQDNNVGPSASTGKLTALVNKGELHVANGDLQMNMSQMADNPNIKVFWPAGPDGTRSTFALPYEIGLVTGAPNADNGKKLIDFLLSKEAQSTVSSVALGLPARKDVKPDDANFAKAQEAMKGVTIWSPNWDEALSKLPDYVKKWNEATGS
ncbi:2-aminoethylphosphonate ABC transporter substrate-binding protein [Mesorhizobium sp. B2-1-3A]|uniref:2-aminoethylphosphonate ABC transporter substrate-binding protein n=1 Tax=Mesorhizobium sp. B2-1-3A TaxID=2589971 RepID=UPI001127FBF5|nr:2-aminoethylphosphonate ABC transporter substrate-binding protein [Mesorhizobium sp. B2-1-3A]TPN02045.1 2-aminoethylphosphonate ABC transporter substrate-binding protein [Mesorhizobium sp. B2-1-3A]